MANGRYQNTRRSVLLLRERERPFGLSLETFIRQLGLAVRVIEYSAESSAVMAAAHALADSENSHAAVVISMESSVISNETSNGGGRFAQPSAPTVYLATVAQTGFGSERTVIVAQTDDPLSDEVLPFEINRIDNRPQSISKFMEALTSATCWLSAESQSTTSTNANFSFQEDWWAWEFQDPQDTSPSFTEFLVDAAFNRSLTQLALHQDVIGKIRARSPLDLKFHYIGWRAAQAWSRLTNDPQYGHIEHINQLGQWIPDLLNNIDQSKRYNYISLGPGDGRTDVHLFPSFKQALSFHSIFLVDVSMELLQLATNALIEEVIVPEQSRDHPRIRAMLGDFEDNMNKLAPVLNVSGVQNLFLLLGFTIGNGSELNVLENLSRGMRSGDYLLFDARLHSFGADIGQPTNDQMISLQYPYDTNNLKSFAFGPVEEACDYVVRQTDSDIHFHFEPQAHGTGYTSKIRGAVNVHIECSGIYESDAFCNKLGIRRARTLKKPLPSRLRLASITFYDFEKLSEALRDSTILKVIWAKKSSDSATFLLQRTDRPL
jgi:uncharacterized SAM-dependent methyltransferase